MMADPVNFQVDRVKKLLIRVLGYTEAIADDVVSELAAIDGAFLNDKAAQKSTVELLLLQSVDLILNMRADSPKFEVQSLHIAYSGGPVMREINRLAGSTFDRAFKYLLATHQATRAEENNNWIEPFEVDLLRVIGECVLNVAILFLQGALTNGNNNKLLGCLTCRALIATPSPTQFYHDLVFHAQAQGDLVALLQPIMLCLSRCLLSCSLASDTRDYRIPYEVLVALTSIRSVEKPIVRPVCTALSELPNFIVEPQTRAVGREAAVLSALGPHFSLSVSAEDGRSDIVDKYFAYDDVSRETLERVFIALQDPVNNVRASCHTVLRNSLSNRASQRRTLQYLAKLITHNWKRAQIQADMTQLANDGFMLNLAGVLYELAAPITLDKIDKFYPYKSGALVELGEEARLKSSLEEANAHAQTHGSAEDAKFTTECFFLTVHAQHIALLPALNRLKDKARHVKELDREIAREKRQLQDVQDNDIKRKEAEHKIRQYEKIRSRLTKERHCSEALLMDSLLISKALAFCVKQVEMLISVIQPNYQSCSSPMDTDPQEPSHPEQAPAEFAALPEFYLEDVLDLLLYFVRASPDSLTEPSSLPSSMNLVQQILVFIINPQYFTNPFLVAKSIELLFYCTPAIGSNKVRPLFHAVAHSPLATAQLYPSLVRFYAACESTGSHTAFYDKFNIRYHIQSIFKQLREDTPHFTAIMAAVAQRCDDDFVRFVNMILNDTTFMLDESLEALKRIHEIELLIDNEQRSSVAWTTLSAEEQRAKREVLAQDEGSVSSWLPLVLRTLEMLNHMTADSAEAFLRPILGDRLAAMLDYNLTQLVGPKCTELVVRKKKEYHWEPRHLVQLIVDVYLNLNCDAMATYIAADERSYSRDTFNDIVGRLTRKSIVPYSQIEVLTGLFERAFELWQANADEEDDFGDVPDEFLDPIMGSLMRDPVRLPSGHVCDRQVIERHLLSQPDNPFTREPLTNQQLAPETDLKSRLESWKSERRGAQAQ